MLVGRGEETARLRAALAETQAGHGGTVLVTGEPGIGKSRLIQETARLAGERDFVVLAGRAVAGGVPTPFRPFAEALAGAGRAGRLPGNEELDGFRPALGRLVPQWRQWQAPGDESLVYLGEAVLRLLRVLSGGAGCLLVLEDLHWADRETLALLEYLADNLAAERALCVGTLRDEDGAEAVALAGALQARGSAAILPLSRLDPAATAEMALACVGAADLPAAVQSLVADRAEGLPFLIEEILAGLIGEGSLTEQGGRWHAGDLAAVGVPGTFADAVQRRLDAMNEDARGVICSAAVLGRRFDWALLGQATGQPDAAVVAALRRGVGLQLVAPDGGGFRFRHALTHEAVLAGLLPPERALLAGQALAAVQAAHPGLPGTWCMLAAELAEAAGNAPRAGSLLLEAGRRDLAMGALASAEHTLVRARALTEVFALSGQVDRAIEMGKTLLARLDGRAGSDRAGMLHLGIARAAIAGARWAEADASVAIARGSASADAAQVDACAAQVAAGRGLLNEADDLARAALGAAESGGLPEVACEALEVIGRVARQRDLDAAEQAFERAVSLATAHGLQLWRLRAVHELGTIDQLRTESVDRLQQARELAVAQGALALTATLDLQIAAGLNKQFRAGEALEAARRSAAASRRFRLATLPMALMFQAAAHAIRGERQAMEAMIAEAISLAPDDPDVPAVLGGIAAPRSACWPSTSTRRMRRWRPGLGCCWAPRPRSRRRSSGCGRCWARCLTRMPRMPRPGSGPRTAPGIWWSVRSWATRGPSWQAGTAGAPRLRRRSPPRKHRWARWWPGTGTTPAGSARRQPWPMAGATRLAGCGRPPPTSRREAMTGWRRRAGVCCARPVRRFRGRGREARRCPAGCRRSA